MARRPNRKTTRRQIVGAPHKLEAIILQFTRDEFGRLKHNTPPGDAKMGGWQGVENMLVALTDPVTLRCPLDRDQNYQVQEYCKTTESGGPNARVRGACIPAFRRLGIELLPDFSAKYVRQIAPDDPRLVVKKYASQS